MFTDYSDLLAKQQKTVSLLQTLHIIANGQPSWSKHKYCSIQLTMCQLDRRRLWPFSKSYGKLHAICLHFHLMATTVK